MVVGRGPASHSELSADGSAPVLGMESSRETGSWGERTEETEGAGDAPAALAVPVDDVAWLIQAVWAT